MDGQTQTDGRADRHANIAIIATQSSRGAIGGALRLRRNGSDIRNYFHLKINVCLYLPLAKRFCSSSAS